MKKTGFWKWHKLLGVVVGSKVLGLKLGSVLGREVVGNKDGKVVVGLTDGIDVGTVEGNDTLGLILGEHEGFVLGLNVVSKKNIKFWQFSFTQFFAKNGHYLAKAMSF